MIETAVRFGPRQALVGVLTDPGTDAPPDRPAVILLNAGRIHHVGPNRLHVKLARCLAGLGFVVLRFDFSGIGDSEPREDHLPFAQSAVLETQEAMRFLGAARDAQRWVLIGICSGAGVAFRTALEDPRVGGVVLINPPSQNYDRWTKLRAYGRKFFRHYWKVLLLRPRSATKAARWRPPPAPAPGATVRGRGQGLLAGLIGRGAQVLMVYSEADIGQDYLNVRLGRELPRLRATGRLEVVTIPRSDHVFTRLESQAQLVDLVSGWLKRPAELMPQLGELAEDHRAIRGAEPVVTPLAWD